MKLGYLSIIIYASFSFSCANLSPQTSALISSPPDETLSEITSLKLPLQKDGDCGPATLAVALAWSGVEVRISELRSHVHTPARNGSLPANMLAATRKYNRLGIKLNHMTDLVDELASGHPVIALLNMGFSWAPVWHYVLLTGYDFSNQELQVYMGDVTTEPMPFSHFERHWELADYWSLVVLPTQKLSASANELQHMQAAAALEKIGKLTPANAAYNTILKRWPRSLSAQVGLANVAYREGDFHAALEVLLKAKKLHPQSKVLKNNLRVVREKLKMAKREPVSVN